MNNYHPKIAIIGAGLAGITAAKTLYNHGFDNVTIFEASNQIGGRIRSVKHESGWIELGAQWIHGQEGNLLYEYAQAKGLIADPFLDHGIEGNGYYCTEDGQSIDLELVKELINFLDEKKNYMSETKNVFDYFKNSFDYFIEKNNILNENCEKFNLLKDVFRWFVIYEVIDNSCENLQTLSSLSYTEWEDCPGVVDLINFKNNYHSLFDEMIQDFPLEKFLQLHTVVEKIQLIQINGNFHVKLYICNKKNDNHNNNNNNNNDNVNNDDDNDDDDGDVIRKDLVFDHVIITSSIGFLKENLNTGFFDFPMPVNKRKMINSLGFGTINKIFLCYNEPFWNEQVKGFQMLWSHVIDEHSYDHLDDNNDNSHNNHRRYYYRNDFPKWVYCIQGFDLVRKQKNMLMAWIGSYGAKEIENYNNQEISLILTNVLKQIVPKNCLRKPIDNPEKIYCSRWFTDPFIRGSYSNRTIEYEKLCNENQFDIEILSEPIMMMIDTDTDLNPNPKPLILFAGEATDREHYSTTHGAMKSGQREADRLRKFYHSTEKN